MDAVTLCRPIDRRFNEYAHDLECTPFTEIEVCEVLQLPYSDVDWAQRNGHLNKTVCLEFRYGIAVNFSSFYDIVEFAFLSRMGLLPFAKNAKISELIAEVLDAYALIIDNLTSFDNTDFSDRDLNDRLLGIVESYTEVLPKTWLYHGDKFSPQLFVTLVMLIWTDCFVRATDTLDIPKAFLPSIP